MCLPLIFKGFIITGLKICGGCSTDGKEDYGIFVKRVLPGGLAEASGKFVKSRCSHHPACFPPPE